MRILKETIFVIMFISMSVFWFKSEKLENKIQLYRDIHSVQKSIISSDSCTIIRLKHKLKLHENHVYRMQLIAGIKNPDSVFTYKEKVCNPINFKNLTSYENRKTIPR